MGVLTSHVTQKPSVFFTIDRNGTTVTPASLGRKDLVVAGGGNGDFIHPTAFSYNKEEWSGLNGNETTTEIFSGKLYEIVRYGAINSSLGSSPHDPSILPSTYVSDVSAIALGEVFTKLKTSELNLITDLVEGGKTLSMLKSTLSMRKLLLEFFDKLVIPRKFKRKRRSNITDIENNQKRLDYITSKWLEYRYGWMPIYHSVYGALQELGREFRQDNAVRVVTSHSISKEASTLSGSGSFLDKRLTQTTHSAARARYILHFNIPDGASVYDWTSLNPAAIAWELLPLSFVVDWFVNVGQTLENLETWWRFQNQFTFGQLVTGNVVETKTSYTGFSEQSLTYFPGTSFLASGGYQQFSGKTKHRNSAFSRIVLPGLPFPGPVRINMSLNSKRLLDAASLLQQLVGSKFR